MRHYVQYHNSERMGYLCEEIDSFWIVTNKAVRQLPDNKVWLISGQGSPREYFLCYVFIVDDVGEATEAGFTHYASGKRGTFFRPPVPIGELPWFSDFRASEQNFSLGLREIELEFIEQLEALAAANDQYS